MISILIPVYNYDINNLINEIHSQISDCKVPFEIIALEDGSTPNHIKINEAINELSHTKLIVSELNIGRVAARQMLSNNSKFDWLLFIDADTLPKSKSFLLGYIKYFNSNYEAIYGGCAYQDSKPKSEYMLRWTYGKIKEEIPAKNRNKRPYKSIASVNFAILKSTFNLINSKINYKGYGLDNVFGALLRTNAIKVHHIDNEVFHIGIEKSEIYIQKKEKAAETLLILHRKKKLANKHNDLLTLFKKTKYFKLNYAMALFFKIFKNKLKQNLISNKPSIKILQLYRISYMCHFDLNSKS
jgi:hypothetical protein